MAAVAVTALLAAVVVVVATGRTNRRVILYGDSLAFEARDVFALSLQHGDDIEVVDRTFGGTAICDRLDRMRRDLHDLQPSAVVLEFIGNNVTPCMRGPNGPLTGDDLVQKYREDARSATDIFAGAGVDVYWMGAPSTATRGRGRLRERSARVRGRVGSPDVRDAATSSGPVRRRGAGRPRPRPVRGDALLPAVRGRRRRVRRRAHPRPGPRRLALLSRADGPGRRPLPRLLRRRRALRHRDGAADPA